MRLAEGCCSHHQQQAGDDGPMHIHFARGREIVACRLRNEIPFASRTRSFLYELAVSNAMVLGELDVRGGAGVQGSGGGAFSRTH